ncbi:MAG TPA: hypothetical protein VJY47_02915 [Candidatus Dojkabacteria bacterium]|nr:hypothetical protein [Candidatus Dojkabacteria bacterium]
MFINITLGRIEGAIKALGSIPKEIEIPLYNQARDKLGGNYQERDPWVFTGKVYNLLRGYGLQEKTLQFTMFLLNGDKDDEAIILLAKKNFDNRLPPLEE